MTKQTTIVVTGALRVSIWCVGFPTTNHYSTLKAPNLNASQWHFKIFFCLFFKKKNRAWDFNWITTMHVDESLQISIHVFLEKRKRSQSCCLLMAWQACQGLITWKLYVCTDNNNIYITLDKNGIRLNTFLISQWKHVLWVLIRSISLRCF